MRGWRRGLSGLLAAMALTELAARSARAAGREEVQAGPAPPISEARWALLGKAREVLLTQLKPPAPAGGSG